jgi:hypothetical protein
MFMLLVETIHIILVHVVVTVIIVEEDVLLLLNHPLTIMLPLALLRLLLLPIIPLVPLFILRETGMILALHSVVLALIPEINRILSTRLHIPMTTRESLVITTINEVLVFIEEDLLHIGGIILHLTIIITIIIRIILPTLVLKVRVVELFPHAHLVLILVVVRLIINLPLVQIPTPPADRPDRAQNRNNSIHDQPAGDSSVSTVGESQYAMQDGDQSSDEDDQFNLPRNGERCSSLHEEMSSSVQSTSLARILEYSAGSDVPNEYLYMAQAKDGSFSVSNPAYSLSAVAVEKLGAWHHQKIDPSVYLDVPNTRKIWHQTGVDLKQNLAAKQAVVDPIQLYAACCRAIKKNTVGTMSRPKRSHEINWCLCIIMNINGVNAYTLCDTGSTTDAISPAFAEACKLDIFDLDSVVGLQLDTTGSCSQIKHGALAQAIYSPISAVKYFDVYDIDRYDAIIGTVFMRAHSISVDFEHNVV